MGVLEQVTELKGKGMSEDAIIKELQQNGVSPKDISDALNQINIKNAVSGQQMESGLPQDTQAPSGQTYQPQTQDVSQQAYAPQTQSQPYQNQSYQDQSYVSQDQYSGYAPYTPTSYSPGTNTDTMIEIAEQVLAEKTLEIVKQLERMNEFKTLSQAKIENMSTRLERIESTIDKLQAAILHEIGNYGDSLGSIKKEMSMMQNSFGKLVDNKIKSSSKFTPTTTVTKTKTRKTSKK
jgi:hypothetical protein